MPEAVELSQTACRYLLTIYELGSGLDAVRSVDVSRRLNVAASSVAHMLGILDQEGMIERRRYGRVRLTPDGLRSANRLYTDRILLETYLREHLGVDGETARLDADRCLCCLSPATRERMSEMVLSGTPMPSVLFCRAMCS